jgi:FixJ family two-component response regulator
MNSSPPLIAIVDDDRFVRSALQRLIAAAGFATETHPSGADFLRSVDDHEPDCVVLDLHMPGLDGFEVQARLTQAHAGVPVVVITGHDTQEARERARRAGAAFYLCKPVDQEALLGAIRAAMIH